MALIETARAWLAQDPDPATGAELSALIARAEAGDAGAADELADAFDGTLQCSSVPRVCAVGSGRVVTG
jgi:phosphomannomutase